MIGFWPFAQEPSPKTPKKRSSVVEPQFLDKMADNAEIEGDPPSANTKKKINLTDEDRNRVIAQLMIGCIWVDDTPKLGRKAILRVAKDFDKRVLPSVGCGIAPDKTFHNLEN
jgi:hypothetical protein